jgi:hypothetical protein
MVSKNGSPSEDPNRWRSAGCFREKTFRSINYFRRRMDPDWVSRSRDYAREMVKTFAEIGKTGPFWQRSR